MATMEATTGVTTNLRACLVVGGFLFEGKGNSFLHFPLEFSLFPDFFYSPFIASNQAKNTTKEFFLPTNG